MGARRRQPMKLKRRKEPTAAVGRGPSVVNLQEELDLRARTLTKVQKKLDQRTCELSEALDQQKATSAVLRVISNS